MRRIQIGERHHERGGFPRQVAGEEVAVGAAQHGRDSAASTEPGVDVVRCIRVVRQSVVGAEPHDHAHAVADPHRPADALLLGGRDRVAEQVVGGQHVAGRPRQRRRAAARRRRCGPRSTRPPDVSMAAAPSPSRTRPPSASSRARSAAVSAPDPPTARPGGRRCSSALQPTGPRSPVSLTSAGRTARPSRPAPSSGARCRTARPARRRRGRGTAGRSPCRTARCPCRCPTAPGRGGPGSAAPLKASNIGSLRSPQSATKSR